MRMSDHPLQPVAPVPPEIEGYLKKLKRKTRSLSGSWNKRWFFVDPRRREFGYADRKNSSAPRSSIFLNDITAVLQFDDTHFQVESRTRNFFLCGDSKASTACWVASLEGYRKKLAEFEREKLAFAAATAAAAAASSAAAATLCIESPQQPPLPAAMRAPRKSSTKQKAKKSRESPEHPSPDDRQHAHDSFGSSSSSSMCSTASGSSKAKRAAERAERSPATRLLPRSEPRSPSLPAKGRERERPSICRATPASSNADNGRQRDRDRDRDQDRDRDRDRKAERGQEREPSGDRERTRGPDTRAVSSRGRGFVMQAWGDDDTY